jgi:hypothetical protein
VQGFWVSRVLFYFCGAGDEIQGFTPEAMHQPQVFLFNSRGVFCFVLFFPPFGDIAA